MPRYIDANEILKSEYQHYDYMADEYYVLVRDIENASTIDAEPVVRCNDCKWFRFHKTAVWCEKAGGLNYPQYDSFCSWGERREDETN